MPRRRSLAPLVVCALLFGAWLAGEPAPIAWVVDDDARLERAETRPVTARTAPTRERGDARVALPIVAAPRLLVMPRAATRVPAAPARAQVGPGIDGIHALDARGPPAPT